MLNGIDFVHVPRTGGTTILTHLSKHDARFSPENIHRTAEQKKAIGSAQRKMFAVVRNPFDRILSIWRYEIKRAVETKAVQPSELSSYTDFDHWLVNRYCSMDWNRAFMSLPQWYWVGNDSGLIVDEVFRYERFDDCLDYLEGMIGEIDRSLVVNHTTNKTDYRTVSAKSRQVLESICEVDCRKFGYEW